MLKPLLANFNQPFPFSRGLKTELLSVLRVSVFVSFLLYFIKPFGLITQSGGTIIGFGIVAFTVAVLTILINHSLIMPRINLELWNVWKEVARSLLYVLVIATSLLLFSVYYLGIIVNPDIILQFVFTTAVLALIPITVRVVMLNNSMLKKELAEAERINSSLINKTDSKVEESMNQLILKSEITKEQLDIKLSTVLFIESSQNYIEVVRMAGGEIRKEMIRLSLIKAMEQIKQSNIIRCHRSYAINSNRVLKVTGNSQGLRLWFSGYINSVPVSRKYLQQVKSVLEE